MNFVNCLHMSLSWIMHKLTYHTNYIRNVGSLWRSLKHYNFLHLVGVLVQYIFLPSHPGDFFAWPLRTTTTVNMCFPLLPKFSRVTTLHPPLPQHCLARSKEKPPLCLSCMVTQASQNQQDGIWLKP